MKVRELHIHGVTAAVKVEIITGVMGCKDMVAIDSGTKSALK